MLPEGLQHSKFEKMIFDPSSLILAISIDLLCPLVEKVMKVQSELTAELCRFLDEFVDVKLRSNLSLNVYNYLTGDHRSKQLIKEEGANIIC